MTDIPQEALDALMEIEAKPSPRNSASHLSKRGTW